jgi:hypothetical protein
MPHSPKPSSPHCAHEELALHIYQDELGYQPGCGKFDMLASDSMAVDGPCGLGQSDLEWLKSLRLA